MARTERESDRRRREVADLFANLQLLGVQTSNWARSITARGDCYEWSTKSS